MKKTMSQQKTLEEAIMDLYLSVKIRKQEEIENYDEDSQEREKDKLRRASPFTIIEYIKSSIEILIDLKVQEKIQEPQNIKDEIMNSFNFEDDTNEYEKLLRKLESDIRTYIKIEHQLKLHSDNLQQKVEELEKQKDELKSKNKQYQEQISKLKLNTKDKGFEEESILNLKNELSQLQQVVKSYEEHNLKIPELEKKLRSQKAKFEKEIRNLETHYKEKLKSYSSKLAHYEKNERGSKSTLTTINANNQSKINTEDQDRVNYNYLPSRDTSVSKNRSTSHSPDVKVVNNTSTNGACTTSRTHKMSADRKKEIEYISSKIDQYKKGIDKKINENIKTIIDDLKGRKESTPLGNKTALLNDRTIESTKIKSDLSEIINYPKSHRKYDLSETSSRKLDANKTTINQSRGNSQDKARIPNSKAIHAMKDNIKSTNNHSPITHIPTSIKETSRTPNYLSSNNSSSINSNSKLAKSNSNNSNIILNQNGVPCYNNIHIYTSGISGVSSATGVKPGDINLRQYIFNKVNKKPNSKAHNKSTSHVSHARSTSAAGH